MKCDSAPKRASPGAALVACVLTLFALTMPPHSVAQPAGSPTVVAPPLPRSQRAEQGPRFADLKADQRASLKPLEKDWASINADSKQKWLDIAGRFSAMPPEERSRIQTQMSDWARMSPEQRGRVRLQFQEATRAAPQNRQAQWEAYQALPPEQKRQLASRAASVPATVGSRPTEAVPRTERGAKVARDQAQTKSNIVPNPTFAPPPRSVAPTVVQAQPGATTNLISKRTAPPAHQQTGMPKIAASPEFVNAATLLPRRGPQGAATRSASASAPTGRP